METIDLVWAQTLHSVRNMPALHRCCFQILSFPSCLVVCSPSTQLSHYSNASRGSYLHHT